MKSFKQPLQQSVMTLFRCLVVLALLGCVSTPKPPSSVNSPEHWDRPYVVLVSFDGFRADYAQKFRSPQLRDMMAKGVTAEGLIPVYPSKTFPNHYSIATGLYADRHGLVANSFYDPGLDANYSVGKTETVQDGTWYGGEPLWSVAIRQGMLASSFFWVGSEAEINGVRPTQYRIYDKKIPNQERLQTAMQWLALPKAQRPHLILLYFSDVDSAGHEFGTQSPEVEAAVADLDGVLAKLRKGIAATGLPVNLLLVSDHGMQDLDKNNIEYPDDYADLSNFQVLERGPQMLLYLNKGESPEVLQKIYLELKAKARYFSVFKREEMPEDLHFSRTARCGDLILIARSPYSLMLSTDIKSIPAANHGYPAREDKAMWGIFYAEGPAFKPGGKLTALENINVYPLVLNLLGLKAPVDIDGRITPFLPVLQPEVRGKTSLFVKFYRGFHRK